MRIITEAGDLKGKRTLVRVDWNVSMQADKVLDVFRIKTSMPSIDFLRQAGAKVILATHLEAGSIENLRQFVPVGVELLQNLRDNPGEEANSEEFAEELAAKADVYVNEAFSVSHREHASIVGMPKLLPSFAGLRSGEEVKRLSKAFYPPHPFLLILGGAKSETKLPLVEKFLHVADTIFIGGTLAPKVSIKSEKIVLPTGDLTALDANRETIENLKLKIENSKFIIWNGPLGKYESGYTKSTEDLAKALSESKAEVIIGGGDTLAAIAPLNLLNKFSFVSTGGGAMLDFLAHGTLPGIEALNSPHPTLS